MARPKEFESPTFRLGGGRSILLSYGRIFYFIAYGGDLGTLSVLFRMWLRYIWFFYRSSMDIWRAVFRNLRRWSFYPPMVHQLFKAIPHNDRMAALRAACIFSVSLQKSYLKYVGIPASDLYELTINLTAQSTHNHCALLP